MSHHQWNRGAEEEESRHRLPGTGLMMLLIAGDNEKASRYARSRMALVGTEGHGSCLWDRANWDGPPGVSMAAIGIRLVYIIMCIYFLFLLQRMSSLLTLVTP